MRLIPILFVLTALVGCSGSLDRSLVGERAVGTLIPTSAITPVPTAPVASAVEPSPAAQVIPEHTPVQPSATPERASTQPSATPERAAVPPTATSERTLNQSTNVPTDIPLQPIATSARSDSHTAPWPPRIALRQIVSGFDRPLHITHAGDGSGRLFVVEKVGRIRVVRDGQILPEPFLDITDRVGSRANEQGLLSVAFHPRYRDNGLLFVNYTDNNGDTVISRFSAVGDRADASSEQIVLTIEQPFANHNGGLVLFGPDGMLYIGMGDGGGAGDPLGAGQDRWTLLGKILRINVETLPYTIPPDNPWADGSGGRQEVWIFGVRNPWRFSFDRATGDLFIADVGQNRLEEVHMLPAERSAGANLGWNIMEGNECFRRNDCDRSAFDLPIDVYPHSLGCSVTGGHVYRGAAFPTLQGVYVFGDFCSGRIWGLRSSVGGWERAELMQTKLRIATFGEDESGELYVAGYNNGVLYRIVVE